jgi:LacI family transcriptional regulator
VVHDECTAIVLIGDEPVKHKRISAQDVARFAGVSRTTVSFVINNTPGKQISEDTRRRVLEAAAVLGYIPNEDARRLALLKTRSIGVFIRHSQYVYSDVFISRVVEGMAQAVNRNRIQLVIQPMGIQEESYISLARQDNVEGIILINSREDDSALHEVIDQKFPAVTIDYLGEIPIDQVYVDNRRAASAMVEFLVQRGHRKIGMITHAPTLYTASRDRLNGYQDIVKTYGLRCLDGWVQYGDFSEESGYQAMNTILSLPEIPSAVFVANDVVAYGAIKAARDAGVSIPEDISFVGFDDDYLSRYLNPPLTTMALPAAGLGSKAVSILIDRLNNRLPANEPVRIVLPTHISVRQSCSQRDIPG